MMINNNQNIPSVEIVVDNRMLTKLLRFAFDLSNSCRVVINMHNYVNMTYFGIIFEFL